MESDIKKAIDILNEDIDLHDQYIKRAYDNYGEPGYDPDSIENLSMVLDKMLMINLLSGENPSKRDLDLHIKNIREYNIPTHQAYIGNRGVPEVWQNDRHHQRWVDNYNFLAGVLERKKALSTTD